MAKIRIENCHRLIRSHLAAARILVIALALSASITAQAAPAALVQDTFVDGGNGQNNKNNGSKSFISVSPVGPKQELIQFDLTTFGGAALSAELLLNGISVDAEGTLELHVVQSAWDESVVTFNTAPLVSPAT